MTPQELKNSILQLAIQGKLVEQRPEEGTAEELYAQIQKEKARLVKEGKLKKDKPLLEIAEDEKPFEIPESWKWVHLNEVATSGLGKTLNKSTDNGELCRYLCSINVYWDGIKLDVVKEAHFTSEDKAKYLLNKGDLLICEGGDAGRCAIWNHDEEMYYQNALHRVRFWSGVSGVYFKYIFELYKGIGIIKRHCKGETIQHLVQTELFNIPFPLPPLGEQKRIVAKIEELLPLIDRYEEAWTKLEAFNKRFPGDMQKSLLQMAIQGKLVEQHPEEGTGEELYQQIQKEKQALIKAGKIKKDKPLPEITEEEKPFEIPECWKWTRLCDIAFVTGGFAFKSTAYTENGVRVIRISDFNESGFVNTKVVRHPFDSTLTPFILEEKNILLCMTGGTVGKSLFVNFLPEKMVTNQRVATIKIYGAIPEYVNSVILAPVTQKVILDSKNSTNDNISMDTINNFLIPLPPLAEQKRIVAKLEELLPLCERLK